MHIGGKDSQKSPVFRRFYASNGIDLPTPKKGLLPVKKCINWGFYKRGRILLWMII